MSNEALNAAAQDAARERELIAATESLAEDVFTLLVKNTQGVARTDAERIGIMVGAAVCALQLVDGTSFMRPGATSAALDVLMKNQTDLLRAIARRRSQVKPVGQEGSPARGDTGGQQGTDDPVSPTVPTENAQVSAPEDCRGTAAIDGSSVLFSPEDEQRMLYGTEGMRADLGGLLTITGDDPSPLPSRDRPELGSYQARTPTAEDLQAEYPVEMGEGLPPDPHAPHAFVSGAQGASPLCSLCNRHRDAAIHHTAPGERT